MSKKFKFFGTVVPCLSVKRTSTFISKLDSPKDRNIFMEKFPGTDDTFISISAHYLYENGKDLMKMSIIIVQGELYENCKVLYRDTFEIDDLNNKHTIYNHNINIETDPVGQYKDNYLLTLNFPKETNSNYKIIDANGDTSIHTAFIIRFTMELFKESILTA